MNTPTPLGKQTFAEYEKEVKEYKAFNLSKVQRIELDYIGKLDDLFMKGFKDKLDSAKMIRKALGGLKSSVSTFTKAVKVAQEALKLSKELGDKTAIKVFARNLDEAKGHESDIKKAFAEVSGAINNL